MPRNLVTEKRTHQKTLLAKLLARENIHVEIRNVDTAMFDTTNRILIIPKMKDYISENIYNMYIGHEVSHALHTPQNWQETIKPLKIPNHLMQIVEDSRIEKLIKNVYPGIRKYFYAAWRELFANNAFGISSLEEVNACTFIDRYNVHFKLGDSFGVEFTPEEQVFVDKGKNITSWEDAIALMKEMWIFIKEEQKKIKQIKVAVPSSFKLGKGMAGGADVDDDDCVSKTLENLDQNKKELIDNKEIIHVYADPEDWQSHVISYRKILSLNVLGKTFQKLLTKYKTFSKPYVSYMAQQFELKKNANEFKLISYNKTGNLDLDRIHEHMIADDLFVRNVIQPQGTSHGLVIMFDWSGSMRVNLTRSLYQLFFLTDFCNTVKIPFEVYAFTSPSTSAKEFIKDKHPKLFPGKIIHSKYVLFNMLSNQMTTTEYLQMQMVLLSVSTGDRVCDVLGTNGTPLCETAIAAMAITQEFKRMNRLDFVNVCFITDGEGHQNTLYQLDSNSGFGSFEKKKNVYVHDIQNSNIEKYDSNIVVTLLNLLQQRIEANIIGFYFATPADIHPNKRLNQYFDELTKKKIVTVNEVEGYTQYHIIDNSLINIEPTRFGLAVDNRLKFILSEFIKMII